ncbi:hypothetical protein [Streptomyces cinereoruber]|uniref:hypothetical protein n=1 Tax=Streptomyces cinereoruber TaxID=67260 RepID=UPI003625AA1F
MREAEQTMREMKGSAQRTAGASVRYIRTNNAGTYAWTGQADTPSPGAPTVGNAYFEITLTSANAAVFLNDLVFELFKSTDAGATYTQVDPTAGGDVQFFLQPAAPIGITPFETKWLASISAPINTYVAFKLQALTTDEATITVERRD